MSTNNDRSDLADGADHAERALDLLESAVSDCDGKPVGEILLLFLDSGSQQPVFAAVGEAASKPQQQRLIPLAGAIPAGAGAGPGVLSVPFTGRLVRAAPRVLAAAALTANVEGVLYAHYGLPEELSRGGHASGSARARAGLPRFA